MFLMNRCTNYLHEGHRYLYANGVLHRDISPGNIIIEWCPDSDLDKPSTCGRLIDLDHAKQGMSCSEQKSIYPVAESLDPLVDHWCSMNKVNKEVARQASHFFDKAIPAMAYMEAAMSGVRPLLSDQICTSDHLGWREVRTLYCPRVLF